VHAQRRAARADEAVPERFAAYGCEPRDEAGNVISRREAVADEEDLEGVDASALSLRDGFASLPPGFESPPMREPSTIIENYVGAPRTVSYTRRI
jgi:hypothetical protein